MKPKTTRNSVILIVLIFIAVIAIGILSRPRIDIQEITDYLEHLAPVAREHSTWLEDYENLSELYVIFNRGQTIEALNKLLDRMEEIQTKIKESAPPEILVHVITKWEDECKLILQAVFQIVKGVEKNNTQWISEAYELLQEAENKRFQWKDELLNLLKDNGIETENTAINIFFQLNLKPH
ncbi:MAG: hypothetical protein JSV74_00640 [Dehalococcoidia bacterium]|nr:MAG: hypothetical protein JSV74_00640 [Dehalococcoidia bacterium]